MTTKHLCSAAPRLIFGLTVLLLMELIVCCRSGECRAISDPGDSPPQQAVEAVAETPPECLLEKVLINDSAVRAGLLYDAGTDRILWQKHVDQGFPIASLTKMMVALLVLEDIYAGRTGWDAQVPVTREAARTGGSRVNLMPGVTVSVKDLFKAAMISSGNDAAYLLAQYSGGSEAAFVARMNRRAAELGMESTRFSNSTGMPAAKKSLDNQASPADLLKLSLEMLKYPELLEITALDGEAICHGKKMIQLRNHNRLVNAFNEVDGFKTGFTRNARFCLVATACRQGRRLIAIALGVPTSTARNKFVADTLNICYEGLGYGPMVAASGQVQHQYAGKSDTNPASAAASGSPAVHRIRKGESLYQISRKYHCSVKDLQKWNRLKGTTIQPGQRLSIYRSTQAASPSAAGASGTSFIYYTVKPGDTLWRIASRYDGVTVRKIMNTNNIRSAKSLKPGTRLKIDVKA